MARVQAGHGLPGIYNSSAPTLDDGQSGSLQLDENGNLKVSGLSGGSSGIEYNATAPTLTDGGTDTLQADVNGNLKVTLATALSKTIDSVTSRPEATTPSNLTASTNAIRTGAGILVGMYVNSTSAGTIKIYDNTAQSGTVLNNTITPAIGYHPLGNASFSTGLSVTVGGTLDVTLYFIPV